MRRLGAAYDWLLKSMLVVASAYLLSTMFVIVYVTVSRTLGAKYLQSAFAYYEYSFVYIMALGSPWLVRTRGHVFIELVTGSVSPGVRRVLSRAIAFLCAAACLMLTVFAADLALKDFGPPREIDVRGVDIPRWIVTASLPVGFALMAIEFARFMFTKELMHPDKIGTFG
jgi:TRAP-type C4-dicarboxylate transport system permease small subunit